MARSSADGRSRASPKISISRGAWPAAGIVVLLAQGLHNSVPRLRRICERGAGISFSSPAGPVEGPEQPGAGEGPVAVGRPTGHPQGPRRLLLGQPGEEAELDQLGAGGLLAGQSLEGLVQGEDV